MTCPTREVHLRKSNSFCDCQQNLDKRKNLKRSHAPYTLRHSNSLEEMRQFSMVPPLSQSSPRENERSKDHTDSGYYGNAGIAPRKFDATSSRNSSKERKLKHPPTSKPVISGHGYAEPTLTHRMRVKLTEPKKDNKENNCMHFIPSGESNKSHHLGVIVQQKLGLLKQYPSKELFGQTGNYYHYFLLWDYSITHSYNGFLWLNQRSLTYPLKIDVRGNYGYFLGLKRPT